MTRQIIGYQEALEIDREAALKLRPWVMTMPLDEFHIETEGGKLYAHLSGRAAYVYRTSLRDQFPDMQDAEVRWRLDD